MSDGVAFHHDAVENFVDIGEQCGFGDKGGVDTHLDFAVIVFDDAEQFDAVSHLIGANDVNGNIPPEALEILAEIGAWMDKNASSIRNCGPAALEKPEFGRITRNGNRLYFHIFENTLGALPLLGVEKSQVESLRLLEGNRPVSISTSWVHSDYPQILFADLGADPVLPDPVDTVLEVRLKG